MAIEQSTPSTDDRNPERCVLTDRLLRALTHGGKRVGPDGTLIPGTQARTDGRRTVWDDWRDEFGQTTGLCFVITAKGAKTFKVIRRVKGEKRPVKYTLGRFDKGEITLADARDQARKARDMMRKGINPVEQDRREQERKHREREEEKARVSFAEMADRYVRQHVIGEDEDDPNLRSADSIEKAIKRDLLSRPWSRKPIVAVTKEDILTMVRDIKADRERSTPGRRSTAAANAYHYARKILKWALAEDVGLEVNVCERINIDREVGQKGKDRDRVLNDHEVQIFWQACIRLDYPYGSALKFLFLSAVRLREAVQCAYSEFEAAEFTAIEFHRIVPATRFSGRVLVVPATRMKGRKHKAVPHEVPIVPALDAILAEVPKFAAGPSTCSAPPAAGCRSSRWGGSRSGSTR
jgi:integrase